MYVEVRWSVGPTAAEVIKRLPLQEVVRRFGLQSGTHNLNQWIGWNVGDRASMREIDSVASNIMRHVEGATVSLDSVPVLQGVEFLADIILEIRQAIKDAAEELRRNKDLARRTEVKAALKILQGAVSRTQIF